MGARLYRQRLQVAGENAGVDVRQVFVPNRFLDGAFDVVALAIGQDQRGVVLECDPGRERGHAAQAGAKVAYRCRG